MNLSKNRIRDILISIFFIIVGIVLLFSTQYFTLIPILNNIFVVLSIIFLLFGLIWIIRTVYKSKINKWIKTLSIIGILIIIAFGSLYGLLIIIFSIKEGNCFKYNEKKYYSINEGWLDPLYKIYEKDSLFTMRKIQEYPIFIPKEVDENMAKEIISGDYKLEKNENNLDISLEDYNKEIENTYKEIYESKLKGEKNSFKIDYNAKGHPLGIIYEDEKEIKFLTWVKDSEDEDYGIYHYKHVLKNEDGTWSSYDGEVTEVYKYIKSTKEVISLGVD